MNVNAGSMTATYPQPSEDQADNSALLQSLSAAPAALEVSVNGHGPSPLALDRSNLYAPLSINSASVLILYGTVTGNSEMLASRLAKRLHLKGLTARVCDMAHCEPSILALVNYVLVIASTYGDGEPPEDAAPFWDAVVRGNDLDLSGVRFSVLALGNTTYDHFCKCGRDFDAALERHGAARFYPRVDCDADYDAAAAAWMDGVLGHFQRQSFAASA